MITKNDAIIRIVIISCIIIFIIAFLTIPCLSSLLDYYLCDDVENINSESLKDDNTVKVRFNSVLHLFGQDKLYYMEHFSENYYLLRIDDEHFLYVHIPTANVEFWTGVPVFEKLSEALAYKPEKDYTLIARVKEFSPEMKEQLKDSVTYFTDKDFKKISNPEITNLEIYLDIFILKQVHIRLIGSSIFLIILIFLLVKMIHRYKELKSEGRFD